MWRKVLREYEVQPVILHTKGRQIPTHARGSYYSRKLLLTSRCSKPAYSLPRLIDVTQSACCRRARPVPGRRPMPCEYGAACRTSFEAYYAWLNRESPF